MQISYLSTFTKLLTVLVFIVVSAINAASSAIAAEPKTNEPQVSDIADIRAEDRFETMPMLNMTGPLMREMMLAEIRAQRGESQQAAQTYLQLANSLKDSRFARRATQWLIQAQQFERAFAAAQVWVNLAPQSPNAQNVFEGLGIAGSSFAALEPVVSARFKQIKEPVALELAYESLVRQLIQAPDKVGAYAFLERLTNLAPSVASTASKKAKAVGHIAKANWHGAMRDITSAEREVNFALAADPNYSPAIWFALQIAVNRKNPEQGRALLTQYLSNPMPISPSHGDARLLYASLLDTSDKAAGAAELLEQTLRQDPAYLRSQLTAASVRAKEGKVELALLALSALSSLSQPALSDSEKTLVARARGQILRDANRHKEVLEVLGEALVTEPEQPELLYEHAMAAERLKQYDLMEKQLRVLIALKPDQALAYNALGYSLAERNTRLEEAEELIRSALSLRPNDGMIIDSLGWVFFRQGRFAKAVEQLQTAYSRLPDGEIAAHLGEALWQLGERAKATDILQEAYKKFPNAPAIVDTAKRFGVKLEAK